MKVIKRNKRLWIVSDDGLQSIYTPPDFLKQLPNRQALEPLVRELEEGQGIKAIIRFETKYNPRL